MKIVFISGLLTTGWDFKDAGFIGKRIRAAEEYAIALANAGVGFFCPHAHTAFHYEKGSTAEENYYLDLDVEFLKRCGALLAMPGWEQSNGARMEMEYARGKDMMVFCPTSVRDIRDIIMWAKS